LFASSPAQLKASIQPQANGHIVQAAGAQHVGSLEQHGLAAEGQIHSTLRRLVQTVQQAQQCAFARAIGTNECHLLARENLE
jgi:hypothetical protein